MVMLIPFNNLLLHYRKMPNLSLTWHQVVLILYSLRKLIISMEEKITNKFNLMKINDIFRACQIGNKEIVKTLLEVAADGRFHPVTKYSPLYIACYHGHSDIVEMLLFRFPELVQVNVMSNIIQHL